MHKKIQFAIQELFDVQKPYEELINSSSRIKQLEILITSSISYADGISILIENKKYDSILPIARSFIELYPSIMYMMENFSDINEFDKFFKKLIVDDMVQDLSMYNSLKSDATILETNEKNADIISYITRWENNINRYFPDKKNQIDNNNKEISIIQIIKSLKTFYKNEYQVIYDSKNNFIGDALKKNQAIISATGNSYEGSYFVYRLLCSETHGNIGSLDARIIYDGKFSINTSSVNNANASAELIYWSLKNIAMKLKELLEQASN